MTTRGIDARRADALVEIFRGVLLDPTLPSRHGSRPHSQVTVSAATLLGLDEMPGELAGYGAIPVTLARRLAAEGQWQRQFVGAARDWLPAADLPGYRPTAELRRRVLARHPVCRFPGCAVPARRCDIDHAQAYTAGGPTSLDNLGPLCRRHHRAKTHGGWRLEARPDGGATWTSPAGRRYRVRPPSHAPDG